MIATKRNQFFGRDWLIAAAITVLALTVRGLGIRYGLPWFHHWDEGWVVDNASRMLQTRDWQPRVYQYGAPLSVLMGWTMRELGAHVPSHVFDPNDTVTMHLIGRIIVVLLSSSGAFAIYVAARFASEGDRGARLRAVYAATSYATAAELVSHGRYAVTDACLVALVAWSLACGALYVRGRETRWALGCVLFAGVAAGFKITGAPAVVIPFAIFVLRPLASTWRRSLFLAALVGPVSAILFFLCNPHVLIHWSTAVADISVRINQYQEGRVPEFLVRHAGLDHLGATAWVLTAYVFHRWPPASAVMALLAAFGLSRALRERSIVCIAGAAHAAIVVVGISLSSRAFLVRNYLIAGPILCIGFGFAMQSIHAWIGAHTKSRVAQGVVVAAFAVVFVVVPFAQAVRTEELVADSRMRAMDWIASRVQGDTTVSVAFTQDVCQDATGNRSDLHDALKRPKVVIASDVNSAAQAATSRADYILVSSHPDQFGEKGDIWPFESVAGYRTVARFDPNPYEHNIALTPTWMGQFTALVLQRE